MVTITSDVDADKTAQVTLNITCGSDEVAKNTKAAVDKVATFDKITLGAAIVSGTDCTATASANLGDPAAEVKATEVTFKVGETPAPAGGLTAYTLEFAKPASDASDASDATKVVWESDNSVEVVATGGTGDLEGVEVTVVYKCFTDAVADHVTAAWGDGTTAISLDNFKFGAANANASGTTTQPEWGTKSAHCYLRATAKVGAGADADSRAEVHAYRYVAIVSDQSS